MLMTRLAIGIKWKTRKGLWPKSMGPCEIQGYFYPSFQSRAFVEIAKAKTRSLAWSSCQRKPLTNESRIGSVRLAAFFTRPKHESDADLNICCKKIECRSPKGLWTQNDLWARGLLQLEVQSRQDAAADIDLVFIERIIVHCPWYIQFKVIGQIIDLPLSA